MDLEDAQVVGSGAAGAELVGRLTVVGALVVLARDGDGELGTGRQDGGLGASAPPAVLRRRPAGRVGVARQRDAGLVDGDRLLGTDPRRARLVLDQQLERAVAPALGAADR